MLDIELPWLDEVQKAKTPARLPIVLTREEVARVLARLEGVHRLIGALLYGTGLRIMEAMRLRVKDVEFARREILVRDGKGNKDRVTMLPVRLVAPLREQIEHARELHRGDLARRLWGGLAAVRARSQVSRRGARVGLAIRLPGRRPLESIRATAWCGATISPTRRSSAR